MTVKYYIELNDFEGRIRQNYFYAFGKQGVYTNLILRIDPGNGWIIIYKWQFCGVYIILAPNKKG